MKIFNLILVSIISFSLFAKPFKSTPTQINKNVVCIHGFLGNKYQLSLIKHNLQKNNYNVHYFSYPSRENYIKEHAKSLVEKLNQIAKENPNEPIDFVTHSMGGIVLKAALNDPNCPNEAKSGKAVLIAPPNQGALFARKLSNCKYSRQLLGNKSGMELMQKNDFDDFGEMPEGVKVLVISGYFSLNPFLKERSDGTLLLTETELKTPHEHIFIKAAHSWLLFSPKAIKAINVFFEN